MFKPKTTKPQKQNFKPLKMDLCGFFVYLNQKIMKNSAIILLLLVSFYTYSQEINWIDNIDRGIELGKQTKKDVFIYLGEKKCVPCRAVQKYAYTNPKFIEFSKKFVMVKVYNDLDKTKVKEQKYFKSAKERFRTKYVPRFIIIRNGKEIANFFKYVKTPETLINEINTHIN